MVGGTAKQKQLQNLPLIGDSSKGASQCLRRQLTLANAAMLSHRQE
jgi:hypothetical protein